MTIPRYADLPPLANRLIARAIGPSSTTDYTNSAGSDVVTINQSFAPGTYLFMGKGTGAPITAVPVFVNMSLNITGLITTGFIFSFNTPALALGGGIVGTGFGVITYTVQTTPVCKIVCAVNPNGGALRVNANSCELSVIQLA